MSLRGALQEPHDYLIERRAMTSEQFNQPTKTDLARQTSAPRARWGRPLAIMTAIVFCISSAFPVVAGFVTNKETWPKWWGVLDVAIAFVLAMLAWAVFGFAQGKVNKPAEDASYRAYRVLIHGIFVMLVVFFLFGDRIVWSNCLTGFAWRAWLLFYGLPAWLTALGATAGLGRFPEE
jgi:VIT1/CCC1 family predicted Fe2+/Mn2+ transporter